MRSVAVSKASSAASDRGAEFSAHQALIERVHAVRSSTACMRRRAARVTARVASPSRCIAGARARPVAGRGRAGAGARARCRATRWSSWCRRSARRAPRLSWQADAPVNPASLMKLRDDLRRARAARPGVDLVDAGVAAGPHRRRRADGDLVIKGSGDPKLVLERMWLLLRRVQQLGVREIRGDIVLDRSAFARAGRAPGDFDGEPLRPYNVQPDALLLNYKSVLLTLHARPGARRRDRVGASRRSPACGRRAACRCPTRPCDDWRGGAEGRLHRPGAAALRRRLIRRPAAKGAGRSPTPIRRSYNERALAGLWREMGGRLERHACATARRPTTPPSFELASPPLAEMVRDINKFSNNVMAQQLFLTLGAGAARRRHAARPRARCCTSGCAALRRRGGRRRDRQRLGSVARLAPQRATLLARCCSAWASPVMPELMSSLPVTGIDGTLRRSTRAAGPRAPEDRLAARRGRHRRLRARRTAAGATCVVAIINHPNANGARAGARRAGAVDDLRRRGRRGARCGDDEPALTALRTGCCARALRPPRRAGVGRTGSDSASSAHSRCRRWRR